MRTLFLFFRVRCIAGAVSLFTGFNFLAGCSTSPPEEAPRETRNSSTPVAASARNGGYGLLYELLGDEANVEKILIIKREEPDLRALVKEISAQASLARKKLDAFAKSDSHLDLKAKTLPLAEQKARESIGRARGKELVFGSSGREFEFKLLLTQVEALGYGSHLSKAVADLEGDPARKGYLLDLARSLEQLHKRTVQFIYTRYRQ